MTDSTTLAPTDQSRAEFEAKFSNAPYKLSMERTGLPHWPGSYRNYQAQIAWEAWQAARRAPAPASQPVAVPAGMEPVGRVLEWVGPTRLGKQAVTIRSYAEFSVESTSKKPAYWREGDTVFTAAQVQAMLAKGLAPGWQAVPVEATKEMIEAYLKADARFHSARSDWAAFLSAAPSGPGRVPLEPDMTEVTNINARIAYRAGWRAAERAHGITAAQKVGKHAE